MKITQIEENELQNKLINYKNNELNSIKWFQLHQLYSNIYNNTILIASNGQSIKQYGHFFHNGCIKMIKKIIGKFRSDRVKFYFRQSNIFLTLGFDGNIRFWSQDYNMNWIVVKSISNINQSKFQHIIVNHKEDIILSATFNQLFLLNQQQNWQCVSSIKINDKVVSFSMSENEQKIIILGFQFETSIFELTLDSKWSLVQKIKNEDRGYQLTFITNSLFVFKTKKIDKLIFYSFDIEKNLFYILKEVIIPNFSDQYKFSLVDEHQNSFHFKIIKINYLFTLELEDQQQENRFQTVYKSKQFLGLTNFKGRKLMEWFVNILELSNRYQD